MGWDGAGGYDRQRNFSADASAGIKILASAMDQEIDDIASAFTNCWALDAQNTPTQNMPMGGNRFINVGAAQSVNDYMRVREHVENIPIYMVDTRSSTDYVSVSAQYFTSVSAGQAPAGGTRILVQMAAHKTSGAHMIFQGHSANIALMDGNRIDGLVSGATYDFVYNSAESVWATPNRNLYPRTQAERDAGVTPSDTKYSGDPTDYNVLRMGLVVNDSDSATRTANDTALSNAMQAVAETGGRLRLPVGIIYISDTITWYNSVAIVGPSEGWCEIRLNDHTKPILAINSTGVPSGSGSVFSTDMGISMNLYNVWLRFETTPADKYTYTSAVAILVDGVDIKEFEWKNVQIYNCYAGIHSTNGAAVFKCDVDVVVNTAYYGWLHEGGDYITTANIKFGAGTCFHGIKFTNVIYSAISINHDSGGLNDASAFGPSNEVPITCYLDNCFGVTIPYFATEQNDAMQFYINDGTARIGGVYIAVSTANLWSVDGTRINNLASAQQGVFGVSDASLIIDNIQWIVRTSDGYDAATTTNTNLFTLTDGADGVYVSLRGGFLDVESYFFVDSTHEETWTDTQVRLSSPQISVSGFRAAQGAQQSSGTVRNIRNFEERDNASTGRSFISPTTLSATHNDFNPTGLDNAYVLRLTPNASNTTITGLTSPSGNAVREHYIINVGSSPTLTLANADSGSSAANRFAIGGDITIGADEGVHIWYDETSDRWRAVGKHV